MLRTTRIFLKKDINAYAKKPFKPQVIRPMKYAQRMGSFEQEMLGENQNYSKYQRYDRRLEYMQKQKDAHYNPDQERSKEAVWYHKKEEMIDNFWKRQNQNETFLLKFLRFMMKGFIYLGPFYYVWYMKIRGDKQEEDKAGVIVPTRA